MSASSFAELFNGATIAVAESLTGGLLGARLSDAPGASAYFVGGVIAYSNEAKVELLGVDPEVIEIAGAVSEQTAIAMAGGVRDRFGATWGVATTGVAGPDALEGQAVGTVFIALVGPDPEDHHTEYHFSGDRKSIREQSVQGALDLIDAVLQRQNR